MKHLWPFRWLLQRQPATTAKVTSPWLLQRKREMISADLDAAMDISEQETEPLPRVNPASATVAIPIEPLWFYSDETTVEPALK